MDISTLKRILNDHLTTGADGLKTLTIAPTLFGSPAIATLFTQYLEGNPLVLTTTESLSDTSPITVIGRSSNTLFARMTVTAQFSIENGEAALLLSAQPDPQWTFVDSFPALKDTLFKMLKFGEDTTLYLASYSVSPTVPLGLSFSGMLQVDRILILNLATWLLGGESEVIVSGSIEMEAGNPLMKLVSAPITQPTSLGFFTLSAVRLEIVSTTTTIVMENESTPLILTAIASFYTGIEIETDHGTVSIPLQADSYLNSPWVKFSSQLDQALDASLDSLSSLANGLSLDRAIPPQLSIQNQVSLKEVGLQVDLSARKLEAVNIQVESKQRLELLEDLISIEKLMLSFRLDDPMGVKQLSMMFTGEFGIGAQNAI